MKESSAILLIMSRVLDYPDEDFHDEFQEIEAFINENIPSSETKQEIYERLAPLYEMELQELQELYVDTFDYKEKTGLYLTAQELGDSRKRGGALIKLRKLIYEGGFEYNGKELSDYIPMLLELLALVPTEGNFVNLYQRMSYAIHRILNNLPNEHPYHRIIQLMMLYVFEVPNSEKLKLMEREREQADLDELPYPILYQ